MTDFCRRLRAPGLLLPFLATLLGTAVVLPAAVGAASPTRIQTDAMRLHDGIFLSL